MGGDNPRGVVAETIDAARDAAQQMVTACLADHRIIAADIAESYPDPLILALVLADLVAYTHTRWTRAIGGDDEVRIESWRELMLDVEEWRAGQGAS